MTVRPVGLRSFTWLPRRLTCSYPALLNALITSAPETTGRRGVKPTVQLRYEQGFMSFGSGTSSKCSSKASLRFARASSAVSPWLAISISRQRATNQRSSWVTAAVNAMLTTQMYRPNLGAGSRFRGSNSLLLGAPCRARYTSVQVPCAEIRRLRDNLISRRRPMGLIGFARCGRVLLLQPHQDVPYCSRLFKP